MNFTAKLQVFKPCLNFRNDLFHLVFLALLVHYKANIPENFKFALSLL